MRELLRLFVEIWRVRPAPIEPAPPLAPVVRCERLGSRLSDVCPTPGEVAATVALQEDTRATLAALPERMDP